jgi:hypothetical protein
LTPIARRQRQRRAGRGPRPADGSDGLAETDAAEHALDALRHSAIEEVVTLGLRRLRDAAFSSARH